MTPYFALLSVPAIVGLFNRRATSWVALLPVLALYVFFIGYRYRVGMDWNNYDSIHTFIRYLNFREVLETTEPLSNALFWTSSHLGYHMLLTNIVHALVLSFGVFSFAKRTVNPWLAIVVATPYLIIAFGMSGVRQAMALGVILYLFSRWERTGVLGRVILVGVASLFHTSAFVALAFVIPGLPVRRVYKAILGAALAVAVSFVLFESGIYDESIGSYQAQYLGEHESVVSPGALMHVGLVWIPAVYFLLFRNQLAPFVHNSKLALYGSLASVVMIVVYFVSTTAASRLILYLYFVPMMVIPAASCVYGRRYRPLMTAILGALHVVILAIWLLYANNSAAHIPYRNVAFERSSGGFLSAVYRGY